MNKEEQELVTDLTSALRKVAELEERCSQKGVSFSTKGQESVLNLGAEMKPMENPLGATASVIKVLHEMERIVNNPELIKEGLGDPPAEG